MKNENGNPNLLERFFTQRLIAQRRVSPHTIASYRDTFRLLLQFVEQRLGKPPSRLALTDLDPSLIGVFLNDLEKHRGNTARSRNLRLTAIRSFYRYLGPSHNSGRIRTISVDKSELAFAYRTIILKISSECEGSNEPLQSRYPE